MRILKLVVGLLVAGVAFAGVAVAATRPTAQTGSATSVQANSAVLNGKVNPNGATTSYHFEWGTTTAYGNNGPTTNVGNGTTSVAVNQTISGLSANTTYHFRIVATNEFGTSVGVDRSFTTRHALPDAVTGPATNLSSSDATLTGTVNPNGQDTKWYFEWGTLNNLDHQTPVGSLGPATTPQNVSTTLPTLQSATVYQYRLVAVHLNSSKSYGDTELLMTYPLTRPYATVSAKTRPRHRLRYPYTFTTTGTIGGPYWIPSQFACIGEVTLRFYTHGRQVRFETAPVLSNCTYSAQTVFTRLPSGTSKPVRLRVVVHFVSTPYLARSRAPIRHVWIGN